MRRVYEELELGDFESVRPGIESYFAGQKGYKTNRYQITPETAGRNRPPLGQIHSSIRLREGRSGQWAADRGQ